MNCPVHPEIDLPDKMTCPLCAQKARRKAYEAQRAEVAAQMSWAVQGLLKPHVSHEGMDTPEEESS